MDPRLLKMLQEQNIQNNPDQDLNTKENIPFNFQPKNDYLDWVKRERAPLVGSALEEKYKSMESLLKGHEQFRPFREKISETGFNPRHGSNPPKKMPPNFDFSQIGRGRMSAQPFNPPQQLQPDTQLPTQPNRFNQIKKMFKP